MHVKTAPGHRPLWVSSLGFLTTSLQASQLTKGGIIQLKLTQGRSDEKGLTGNHYDEVGGGGWSLPEKEVGWDEPTQNFFASAGRSREARTSL